MSTKSIITAIIAASVITNAALWALALTMFPRQQAAAVLHYTIGSGIDFIGEGSQILVLPAIGLLVLVSNTALAGMLRAASVKAAWVLLAGIPIVQGMLAGAFIIIWRLNI